MIYAITDKGAKLLALRRKIRAADLRWYENDRRVKYATMVHDLEANEFLIALRLATASFGFSLGWPGHHYLPPARGDDASTYADAFFWLEHPERHRVPVFLELDRGTVMLARMRERYERYFQYWRAQRSHADGIGDFRVLTVTGTAERMHSLRRVAATVGVNERFHNPWRGFLFATQEDFALDHPQTVLQRIFYFPTDEPPISLLE